jgi:Ca2+-binding EF-hand superfamily protein
MRISLLPFWSSFHQLTAQDLFDLIDSNGDGALDRDEVVAAAATVGLTNEEAGALFDELDADQVR